MEYKVLDVAFSGLMHDIGKFYQRTKMVSDLTEREKLVTPMAKAGYYTHLHSGYTSRFFHEYLGMDNELEMITSSHHIDDQRPLAKILRKADQIASSIDRKDEEQDYEENNKKGTFQQVRLSSVVHEVDFGKQKALATYPLRPFHKMGYPTADFEMTDKNESVGEYLSLFQTFINDLKSEDYFTSEVDKYCFDRLYALMYEYTTLVPASTFEGSKTYVSLFDHSKLTSAIASCLYLNDTEDENFIMFEFDVSGIQKFIFKVTEGKDTKRDVAKSLRGRSFLVSAITNIITYSYLYEFGLTQSNIIFNTGGGALLLLPKCKNFEEKLNKVTQKVQEILLDKFSVDINYVYAWVECDRKELETFKISKATKLKSKLDEEKNRKFNKVLNSDFFFNTPKSNYVCKMCGTNFVEKENDTCDICKTIIEMSDFCIKHDDFFLVYDFNRRLDDQVSDCIKIDMGYMDFYLISKEDYPLIINKYDYIESLNQSHLGNTRLIANLVPKKNDRIIPFENMVINLVDTSYGDPKLGILKMDVDNLGAIFAFGMEKQRSLSKFLTLSRMMENFFGHELMNICVEVSKKMNLNISQFSDNESMFYINYAGGDDLVIMGPASGILELSKVINERFSEYTLNKNITISGGITIQSPSAPIRFGIKEAEEYLNQSKALDGKNGITLIHTSCKMNEYEQVLQQVNVFRKYITNQDISRTNFYNMMKVLDVENMEKYYRNIPILLYSLKRNVKNKDVRQDLISKISMSNMNCDQLKKLVLEMKLAIMQTRG